MPLQKPKTRFNDLTGKEKKLIRQVALDFMKYKGLSGRLQKLLKLPLDDIHKAIIDMFDYGLLKLVSNGDMVNISIYDYESDSYNQI